MYPTVREVTELDAVEDVVQALLDMLFEPNRAVCTFKHLIHSLLHMDSVRMVLEHLLHNILCLTAHMRVEFIDNSAKPEMHLFIFHSPAMGFRMSHPSILSEQEYICVMKLIDATMEHRSDAFLMGREDVRGDYNRIVFITPTKKHHLHLDRPQLACLCLAAFWEIVSGLAATYPETSNHNTIQQLFARDVELAIGTVREMDYTLPCEEVVENIRQFTKLAKDMAVSRHIITASTVWHE